MDLPIYKLIVDDTEEFGVDYVALVDEPATQHKWMAFKEKMLFKADTEKRIISGALMVAGMPIYRKDHEHGEFYVVFDGATITQIRDKFFKNGFSNNVNKMHNPEDKVEGVYMVESFQIDEKRGIETPKGFDELPEGSWFGSYKVENEDVWDNFVKSGEFQGFSVEGIFDMELVREEDEEIIEKLIDVMKESPKELSDILNTN